MRLQGRNVSVSLREGLQGQSRGVKVEGLKMSVVRFVIPDARTDLLCSRYLWNSSIGEKMNEGEG